MAQLRTQTRSHPRARGPGTGCSLDNGPAELTQSQREVRRGGRDDSQVAAGRGGVLQGDDHLCKDKGSSEAATRMDGLHEARGRGVNAISWATCWERLS